MANWTALAGFSGLASALDEIQNRRVREAQLQKELTANQGEWTPATGGGGGLGFLDALLGHNRPGEIGFGSQRYQFKPYEPVTPDQATAWGMTYPETTTTPEYLKELPTGFQGPPELVPAQETTRDVPMPGIVGMRLGPKEKMALFSEQLKERRELARLEREQALFKDMNLGNFGVGSSLPGGTPLPDETPARPTTGPAQSPAPAPASAPALTSGAVPGVETLSPQFLAKTKRIATSLGMNHDDFLRVMYFETGGEFSPATRNRAGSGATGLIQFTPDTAKRLGTTPQALAAMTPEQQLDYVEKYLAPHKGKLGTLKDLYLAILYPAAIGKSDETVLFTPDKNPTEYRQNAGLDTDKKGYVTVGDAVAAVQRSTGMETTAVAQRPAQAPAAAGTATAPAAAPVSPLTQKYAEQFRKGDEAAAIKVITTMEDQARPDPANPKQLSPADLQKIEAAKQALGQVFPRGTAQTQAQAQTPPDTSMMVAGGGGAPGPQPKETPQVTTGTASAPAPAQTSPTTAAAPAPPQEGAPAQGTQQTPPVQPPFQLSPEGRRQIVANNTAIERNNQEIQALDAKQRQLNYLAATRKNPQLAGMAGQLGQRIADLSRDNQSRRDVSEALLQREATEWRTRNDVLAKEWRERQQRLEERRARPEELKREKTAEKTAEEEFRLGQSLQDVQKDDASLFRDPRTAEPVDPTLPYRQVLAGQKRTTADGLPEVRKITKDQQERLEAIESALPRVQRIQQYIDQIYGPNGALASMTPADRGVFISFIGGTPLSERLREQFAQKYPELAAATKYINANSEALARAIAGVKGAASEGDVQRARDMVANLTAAVTLWPPARFGISLPDTRAVALRTMNDLVQTLEGNTGQVLRNPNFRYPTLRRYEIAEESRVPSERTPAPAPTQATGLNPAWVQQRLPAMTPEQIREAPPEVIRDINRPSDIKGLSIEQSKALAARLRQRNEAAVKLRRAS